VTGGGKHGANLGLHLRLFAAAHAHRLPLGHFRESGEKAISLERSAPATPMLQEPTYSACVLSGIAQALNRMGPLS